MKRLLSAALSAGLLIGPAVAQDASELLVRLNRVEGQMRQLSGQVEQLQFDNRQLRDQLRKFQEDTEFRFTERSGTRPAPSAAAAPSTSAPARPVRRGDAFDPDAAPAAPGAPRPLAGAPPPAPRGSIAEIIETVPGDEPLDLGGGARPAAPSAPQPAPARVAPPVAAASGDARADYDAAYAYLIQKQHDQAEEAFRRFLQAHPRDRLAADAAYWLGDSYLQRKRAKEAADQFLKVSTEHANSPKAPDAMLKLGIALSALGAKDQACATFAQLERRYPAASASVKSGVDREQKRVRCTG